MTKVTLHITFNVVDEKLVRDLAEEGSAACWQDDLDNIIHTQDLGAVVMEALLNSNPAVPSYDELGLEIVNWTSIATKEN